MTQAAAPSAIDTYVCAAAGLCGKLRLCRATSFRRFEASTAIVDLGACPTRPCYHTMHDATMGARISGYTLSWS